MFSNFTLTNFRTHFRKYFPSKVPHIARALPHAPNARTCYLCKNKQQVLGKLCLCVCLYKISSWLPASAVNIFKRWGHTPRVRDENQVSGNFAGHLPSKWKWCDDAPYLFTNWNTKVSVCCRARNQKERAQHCTTTTGKKTKKKIFFYW